MGGGVDMKLRKKLKNVVGRIRRRPATRRNEALARAGGPHRTTELTNAPGGEHGAVPSRRISDLRRIENLRQKPWYSVDLPADVMNVVGMIHPDERRLLYTLARDYFSDQGRIVDGGAFLGSSSLALGWGLMHREYPAERVIDAYDTFIIHEDSVRDYLGPEQGLVG